MKRRKIDKPISECNEAEILLKYGLNKEQKRFAELFTTEKDFMGDGVECYVEAYGPDTTKKNWYNSARACASRLLTRVNVIDYIGDLLTKAGWNDDFVDKQTLFLVKQSKDLHAKAKGIDIYNKLKKRIDSIEVKIDLRNILNAGANKSIREGAESPGVASDRLSRLQAALSQDKK